MGELRWMTRPTWRACGPCGARAQRIAGQRYAMSRRRAIRSMDRRHRHARGRLVEQSLGSDRSGWKAIAAVLPLSLAIPRGIAWKFIRRPSPTFLWSAQVMEFLDGAGYAVHERMGRMGCGYLWPSDGGGGSNKDHHLLLHRWRHDCGRVLSHTKAVHVRAAPWPPSFERQSRHPFSRSSITWIQSPSGRLGLIGGPEIGRLGGSPCGLAGTRIVPSHHAPLLVLSLARCCYARGQAASAGRNSQAVVLGAHQRKQWSTPLADLLA